MVRPYRSLRGAALLGSMLLTEHASADLIATFEDASGLVPVASYTESGVTFTGASGEARLIGLLSPNGTRGLIDSNTPKQEIRATILGGADWIAVDLGDFRGDADLYFLEGFDAAGQSLGFVSRSVGPSFRGMVTLELEAVGIASAIFGAREPSTNGSSCYADNFAYRPTVVPEPPSLALAAFGVGFGAFTARIRTRRKGRPPTERWPLPDTSGPTARR